MLEFARFQPCALEDIVGRAAEPALREDRHAAAQTHVDGATKVEVVVTDLKKITIHFRAPENCDRLCGRDDVGFDAEGSAHGSISFGFSPQTGDRAKGRARQQFELFPRAECVTALY